MGIYGDKRERMSRAGGKAGVKIDGNWGKKKKKPLKEWTDAGMNADLGAVFGGIKKKLGETASAKIGKNPPGKWRRCASFLKGTNDLERQLNPPPGVPTV